MYVRYTNCFCLCDSEIGGRGKETFGPEILPVRHLSWSVSSYLFSSGVSLAFRSSFCFLFSSFNLNRSASSRCNSLSSSCSLSLELLDELLLDPFFFFFFFYNTNIELFILYELLYNVNKFCLLCGKLFFPLPH